MLEASPLRLEESAVVVSAWLYGMNFSPASPIFPGRQPATRTLLGTQEPKFPKVWVQFPATLHTNVNAHFFGYGSPMFSRQKQS